MDHYCEFLVRKTPDKKDMALRGLIIALTMLVSLFCVACAILFLTLPLVLIMIAAVYLGYTLALSTIYEYEYLVTNNDFDVDKIIGKRKRKRLITVNLKKVEEIGEYTGKEGNGVAATVMADDNTGENAWYLIANHESYGKVLLLFTPSLKMLKTINYALPYSLRLTLPDEDGENDTEE